jgi:hypothetical protein
LGAYIIKQNLFLFYLIFFNQTEFYSWILTTKIVTPQPMYIVCGWVFIYNLTITMKLKQRKKK